MNATRLRISLVEWSLPFGVTMEVRDGGGSALASYRLRVGRDRVVFVSSPEVELVVSCCGVRTPMRMSLDTSGVYTCRVSYVMGFGYALYDSTGYRLCEDRMCGSGCWLCLIPVLGLGYYLLMRRDSPLASRAALRSAVVGLCLCVVVLLCRGCFGGAL